MAPGWKQLPCSPSLCTPALRAWLGGCNGEQGSQHSLPLQGGSKQLPGEAGSGIFKGKSLQKPRCSWGAGWAWEGCTNPCHSELLQWLLGCHGLHSPLPQQIPAGSVPFPPSFSSPLTPIRVMETSLTSWPWLLSPASAQAPHSHQSLNSPPQISSKIAEIPQQEGLSQPWICSPTNKQTSPMLFGLFNISVSTGNFWWREWAIFQRGETACWSRIEQGKLPREGLGRERHCACSLLVIAIFFPLEIKYYQRPDPAMQSLSLSCHSVILLTVSKDTNCLILRHRRLKGRNKYWCT